MKKINKITIFLAVILGLFIGSCDGVLDLDLLEDPNGVTLDLGKLDRYMNALQVDFADFTHRMGDNGAELTRIEYMFGKLYANNFDATSTNSEWELAYQNMFSDMREAIPLAQAEEKNKHIGVINVLKAYTFLTLVDFYGDVPFSEAAQPEEFLFPHTDDDESVYLAAIDMLDAAIGYFQTDGGNLQHDHYYDNDFSKWIKLANTLKMKAYLGIRLVDASAQGKFDAIVSSGNYIQNTADDFQFQYGTNESSPNTRHNYYDDDYTSAGAGNYRSNWLMNEMLFDEDPRIRYYFYRQHHETPGAPGVPPDQQRLTCSTQSKPAHYPADMIYCSVEDGYWGRDHGNAEGIPPDNTRRTAVGVYPAGGRFDDNETGVAGFPPVNLGIGGQGAGITPIMLASWVDLMKAEMEMANNDFSSASNYLESALTKSIDKVMGFGSLDPSADLSYAPTASDVTNFIANIVGDFSNASTENKWEILAKQQFIGHYGNGIDAYNFYRRTGYPHSLQYNIEPNSGNFVRSFVYPSVEADVNTNIVQKPNVDIQVFWDNNPPSPGFPAAN